MQLRRCLVDIGLRGRAGIDGALTVIIALGLILIGVGLRQLRLRLQQVGGRSAGDFEIDLGAGKLGCARDRAAWAWSRAAMVVARVDLQQQFAGVDEGVVVDVKFSDVAGDLWGENNGVTSV